MTCTLPDPKGSNLSTMPVPTFVFKHFYLGCLAQASYLLGADTGR